MTDIRIDRPEETKTQTKKYYKSKYCFSLHLPKELEEKVKDAAESEARNVTSYITSLIFEYSTHSEPHRPALRATRSIMQSHPIY